MLPINKTININLIPYQGRFGAMRKHDYHTGLDLYCEEGTPVYAMESGTVVNVCNFTGKNAGSEWWNDTFAILIEGKSGVILYGEIIPLFYPGVQVQTGQLIGYVMTVLKKDKKLPMCMLHIELYKTGYRGDGEWWDFNHIKSESLLNVEKLFK